MPTTHQLSDLLERSFHGGAWHGPAVAEALDGIDAVAAARRPIADGHSIWEIVHHLTVWLEVPRRRIEGVRGGDPPPVEDWPAVEDPSPEAWERALEALHEAHHQLSQRVAQLTDAELDDPVAGSDPTVGSMLLGVIQHNAYHGGQIALLRKSTAGA